MAINTNELNVAAGEQINESTVQPDSAWVGAYIKPLTKNQAVLITNELELSNGNGWLTVSPQIKDAIIGLLELFTDADIVPHSSLELSSRDLSLKDAIGLLITNLQVVHCWEGNPSICTILTKDNTELYQNTSSGLFIGRNINVLKGNNNSQAVILDVGHPAPSVAGIYDPYDKSVQKNPTLYLPASNEDGRAGLELHGTLRLADDCKIVDSDGNIIHQGKRV